MAELAGQPHDVELCERTLAAVRGAAAAADAYLERGGWCPRFRLPTMTRFDSGWPVGELAPPAQVVRAGGEAETYQHGESTDGGLERLPGGGTEP